MHIQSQSQLTNKFNSYPDQYAPPYQSPPRRQSRDKNAQLYTPTHTNAQTLHTIIIYKYIYIYAYKYTKPSNTLTPSHTFSNTRQPRPHKQPEKPHKRKRRPQAMHIGQNAQAV